MPLTDAALALTEEAIHQYLALDPPALARLETLHGKVIAVEFAGFGQQLYFVPSPGRLLLLARHEGDPDCLIRGSLIALAKLGQTGGKSGQLFGGDVHISGDAVIAHRFGQILSRVDIDWEEHLSHFVGDIPAHRLAQSSQEAHQWASRAGRIMEQDLGEYLQEEALFCPHLEEIREFNSGVDRIRDDVERLEVRVNRLMNALDGAGS